MVCCIWKCDNRLDKSMACARKNCRPMHRVQFMKKFYNLLSIVNGWLIYAHINVNTNTNILVKQTESMESKLFVSRSGVFKSVSSMKSCIWYGVRVFRDAIFCVLLVNSRQCTVELFDFEPNCFVKKKMLLIRKRTVWRFVWCRCFAVFRD